MKFDFVINDQSVGQIIGPKDGFLCSLEITQTPTKYEIPEWDEGRLHWRRGYLQLKASRDVQSLYSACPGQWGYLSKLLVGNQSLGYLGDLRVLCVPLGAIFELTLSDVAIDRAVSPALGEAINIFPPQRLSELQKILRGERPASR